jgi:3-hydroxyisobutyrate dehydrogenase
MAGIAFIGLGNMGGPMSANLVKAGFQVTGFDLNPEAVGMARAAGVTIAESARAAVRGCDTVITMLPTGRHVKAVFDDIVADMAPGTLFIDSSTIDVETARELERLCIERGLQCLDAPVSGGAVGAQAATLTFMVGGSEEAFERSKPILAGMGKRQIHCGKAGSGQAAKICNNMITGISMVAVSEAFLLAQKLELSPQALFDVVSTSSGNCWALSTYCPWPGILPTTPSTHNYKPGFALDLMLKDMRLAQDAVTKNGSVSFVGAVAAQVYALYSAMGHGNEDYSAVMKLLQGLAEEQASGDARS